jgi:hypothetical protein
MPNFCEIIELVVSPKLHGRGCVADFFPPERSLSSMQIFVFMNYQHIQTVILYYFVSPCQFLCENGMQTTMMQGGASLLQR